MTDVNTNNKTAYLEQIPQPEGGFRVRLKVDKSSLSTPWLESKKIKPCSLGR
ncbi:MAG: hypothetical protein GDA53_10945 [Rhodobacteraceae bacterium]|nr:hypothetical protein [Paracoccaceae bacterium]